MPDQKQLYRMARLADVIIGRRENIEILFSRDTTDIQEANFLAIPSRALPKRKVSARRIKQIRIQATRQNLQFFRREPSVDPTFPVLL